ncbi:hypothetical protein N7492_009526 [Penicillium capsulatum]|uniref:Uncharacterized protein n=1 Tax=Penicillium capsulatum TaxID=69766 RepID=A0A9W9HU54_9EURO|nr:hypothetical protein N7492_009526 [Penicillium capsulatum]KAJ6106915.1 hypothetical protein N7512_010432 [Penicillium capsulatum]
MVYYIRFLKTPRFEQQKAQVFISALICITTDLGDDFLAEDVDLIATWAVRFSRENVSSKRFRWQAGARQLPIQIPVHLSLAQMNNAPHAAVLEVHPQNSSIIHHVLGESSMPLVVSGCSDHFHWPSGGAADKLIQREFKINEQGSEVLKIWEETGNSIARHIWDAALASMIILRKAILGATELPDLDRLLHSSRSSPLQVVELGAGCGIVGITLAVMLNQVQMLLTDLPEVEEIIMRNIHSNSPRPDSSVTFQTLDWDDPPADLCSQPIDLILVSDCTYNADSLPTLVSVLDRLVRRSPDALVLVALKRRHDSEAIFFDLMQEAGFTAKQTTVSLPAQYGEIQLIEVYAYRR